MKQILFIIFLCNFTYSQEFIKIGNYKDICSQKIENHHILKSASGDINSDGYIDIILIFDNPNSIESKRIFVLYTSNSEYKFKLYARNDNIIQPYVSGGAWGEPLDDVVIEKRGFRIEHYGGSNFRWNRTTVFKYSKNKNNILLVSDTKTEYNINYPNSWETIILMKPNTITTISSFH